MLLLTCPVSDPRQWRLWRLLWVSQSPHLDGPPCPNSPAHHELTSGALLAPPCKRKCNAGNHTEKNGNDSDSINFSVKIIGPPQKVGYSHGCLPLLLSCLLKGMVENCIYLVTWFCSWTKQKKTQKVLGADLWICTSTVLNLLTNVYFLNSKHSDHPISLADLGSRRGFFCSPSANWFQKLGIRWVLVASEFTIVQAKSTLPELQHYMNLGQEEVSSPYIVRNLTSTPLWTCKLACFYYLTVPLLKYRQPNCCG